MTRTAFLPVLLMFAGIGQAGPILLTFSEVPANVGNGYSVQGVTFTWSEPASLGLFVYGASVGTGALGVTLLDDPVLQGATDGNLGIHFDSPTTVFSFALAVCCGPMTGGIGGTITTGGSQSIPVNLIADASQGLFSYSGVPISDATLSLSPDAVMFALDNFAFEAPDSNIPEPASALLTAAGLVAGIVWARRKARPRRLDTLS